MVDTLQWGLLEVRNDTLRLNEWPEVPHSFLLLGLTPVSYISSRIALQSASGQLVDLSN